MIRWNYNIDVFSICVLFISLMQLVNGAQFLNTTSIPLPVYLYYHYLYNMPATNAATVIVPLTSIYATLQSNKLDLNMEYLNLIWLFALYVPRFPSFISNQIFVLNLAAWFSCLTSLLFFDVPSLYYYNLS